MSEVREEMGCLHGEARGCRVWVGRGRGDSRSLSTVPGAVLYALQASVPVAAGVSSLEVGKGRGWRKGNACRKPSGSVRAGREARGKMPDRWRNAGGGCGGVPRILGGCSLCTIVGYFFTEKPEAILGEAAEGDRSFCE